MKYFITLGIIFSAFSAYAVEKVPATSTQQLAQVEGAVMPVMGVSEDNHTIGGYGNGSSSQEEQEVQIPTGEMHTNMPMLDAPTSDGVHINNMPMPDAQATGEMTNMPMMRQR